MGAQIGCSADINGKVVTCKASEVLRYKEGICNAKAHLLATILRANGIPSGFCYQRLILGFVDLCTISIFFEEEK